MWPTRPARPGDGRDTAGGDARHPRLVWRRACGRRRHVDLNAGEVVGLVGGNGAGKSTLMKVLSGAQSADAGRDPGRRRGRVISRNPRDAKAYGIETIYQTLALADNLDAPANVFLGRELVTRVGSLDDAAMESATRKVMGRLNPRFRNFKSPVQSLSGGQRQAVAIARAVHFNARILIMDEPTAALGPGRDRPGARPHPAAQERGHRHLPHQPRHPRRVRPVGPDQRHVPRPAGRTRSNKDEVTTDDVLAHDHPGQEARGGHRARSSPSSRSATSHPREARRQRGIQVPIDGVSPRHRPSVLPGLRDTA